mgnify:CR=1 FL=1
MKTESSKETTDYYKHLSLFWTDIMHLMASKPQALTSIGPMRAFTSNSKKISTELIEINEVLGEFNQHYTEYYKQLADTWSIAQKKVNHKSQKKAKCQKYGISTKLKHSHFIELQNSSSIFFIP